MSALSEDDWEQLNAYYDGELLPEAEQAFRARIAREPRLASALESLSEVSTSLAVMRPNLPDSANELTEKRPVVANSNRKRMNWALGGALAASLLAAVFFGAEPFRAVTPVQMHISLSNQEFSYDQKTLVPAASSASLDAPNLEAANLIAAVLQVFEEGTVTHYVGQNGCRLSYFRGNNQIEMPLASQSQSTAWTTTDGIHHAIIATGMDAGKFEAIASYLLTVTRRDVTSDVYAALTTATQTAAPCVG
ncbi:MAG: hypothetical protein AAGC81_05895 [Pseudomonadota bacterium]